MRRFFLQHLALAFVINTIALLFALAAISYTSFQRSTALAQSIARTEEVRNHLNLLRAGLAEGELAWLGHTLTGDDSYLDSFQKVVDRSSANLETVRQLTADSPLQQRTFRQVEGLMVEHFAVIRTITNLRRNHETAAAVHLLRAKAEPLSAQIRRLLQTMTDEERRVLGELFAQSEADTRSTKTLRRTVAGALLTLLLAILWLLARSLTHTRLEAQRESFFQVSLDMLCFAGFDGYFQRLNPAWEKTLGFTAQELMSKPQIEFVHPDDRESTLQQAAAVRTGIMAVSFENRFVCKDGSYKWLLWNAVPIPKQQIIYAAAHDLTERKRMEALLHELSLTDELTKLRNRRGFLLLAEQELELIRSKRTDNYLWLIFADLDGLKQINDELGHDVGSQALIHAADILTKSFRKVDVIARLGGDEFAILALDNDPDGGNTMSTRIQERLRRFNDEQNLPYHLALSVGVVKVDTERVASIDELLNEADHKMYEHKRSKKRANVPA